MSFDLCFMRLEPGETWQDAMERLEEAAEEERALDDDELARWQAVRGSVQPLLAGAEEFSGESFRELSHDATGIQLRLSPGELSLTVPYWYSGPDAQELVARLRSVAAAVEHATGLTAYDPQADAPFLGAGEDTAAATFDQVDAALRSPRSEPAAPPAGKTGGIRGLFRKRG